MTDKVTIELSWTDKNLVGQHHKQGQKRKWHEFYHWSSLESVFDHIGQKYEIISSTLKSYSNRSGFGPEHHF